VHVADIPPGSAATVLFDGTIVLTTTGEIVITNFAAQTPLTLHWEQYRGDEEDAEPESEAGGV
jgi:hypothetical protein